MPTPKTPRPLANAAPPRKSAPRDAVETARRILEAATTEFAEQGYKGARIERIVAQAGANVRMVYYYYTSKEGLYLAVLERIYEDIRGKEQQLALDHLPPLTAMAALVDFTFSHFAGNPAFAQITLAENLQRGAHVAQSQRIPAMASPLITQITALLTRGVQAGVFRADVDPLQLYVSIVALAAHHINNSYTLSATFGTDLATATWRDARRSHARDVVLSYVTNLQPTPLVPASD